MKWNTPDKIRESPYPGSGYVPEGRLRIRSKFFWIPTTIDNVTYWLESRTIQEESKHRWYGGSEGGMVVDWDIKQIIGA